MTQTKRIQNGKKKANVEEEINEILCKCCESWSNESTTMSEYCAICGPYTSLEIYDKADLSTWAREMIDTERDILDDVEPLGPPVNDREWLDILVYVLGDDMQLSANGLALSTAFEAIDNYPSIRITKVEETEEGIITHYSTEGPDGHPMDGDEPQWCDTQFFVTNPHESPPDVSECRIEEALAEILSGTRPDNNPAWRVTQVNKQWSRALRSDPFTVDRMMSRWVVSGPDSLLLVDILGQILLGHHGYEPIWRFQSGIITDCVNWRNYVSNEWKRPRAKSFRFLRGVVEQSSQIRASPGGLVISGNSGAMYLLSGSAYLRGDPVTVVLNAPAFSGGDPRFENCVCVRTVCGDDFPLGDRIAALALALVNDVETAKKVRPLHDVVKLFDGGAWLD
jgi:hypothetical protein